MMLPHPRIWMLAVAFAVASLMSTVPVHAQPEGPPTQEQPVQVPDSVEDQGWQIDLASKLSGSQAAYRNWQEGGLSAFAITSGLDGKAIHGGERWIQIYELRLAFGLIQQDTLAVRKAEDLIRVAGALRYNGRGLFRVFNPTLATALRTQFAAGFDYDKDPLGEGRTPPVRVSDFFAPATITQSLGLTYDPSDSFSQRLSAAGKETVVIADALRPIYDVAPNHSVRYEAGVESVTSFDREVATNIRVQSTLTLFKAFVEPEPVDLIWETLVAMKVNDWMNVNFDWVNIYDANQSEELQVKERLSLGVSFDIL